MSNLLFSIVTATYNAEKYLQQSILSVLGQSFTDFEYIFIDGKSQDGTVDIIRQFETDKRIIWMSEPDTGIYDAWNKALAMAKGEWLMFLGADDILRPDALSSYAAFIATHGGPIDYLSSKMDVVQPDSMKHIRIVGSPWTWKEFRFVNHTAHQGALHSKGLFRDVGIFNATYKISGDYELLLRKRGLLKTAFMDKVTVTSRYGGMSASLKALREQKTAILTTGKVSPVLAGINYYRTASKLALRKFFEKVGIYIYLRSSRSK